MQRKRYRLSDVAANRFYQMPKFLFEGELKKLSNDARVLYALLKDRHELSLQNKWVNKNGEVFLIFTREDMCEFLGCSQPTIRKSINQLKEFNLMDEERQGLNKPNLIFLYYAQQNDEDFLTFWTEKPLQSGLKECFTPECKDFSPNDTDINKTNINNTKSHSQSHSHCQTEQVKEKEIDMTKDPDFESQVNKKEDLKNTPSAQTQEYNKSTLQEPCDNYTNYKQKIKVNISFDNLLRKKPYHEKIVQELMNCILDVICTKDETVKINGEEKDREMVKEIYLSLNQDDIEHVIERYESIHHKITHLHSYLKTMLYTISQENGHFYTNELRSDGIV